MLEELIKAAVDMCSIPEIKPAPTVKQKVHKISEAIEQEASNQEKDISK